jgi:uncharacterized membrane protein/protein-disulfide isomerase
MARRSPVTSKPTAPPAPPAPLRLGWLAGFAALGLAAAGSSTWVHYQLVSDPAYSGFCDINSTFSCAQAYTSRYGSVAGVPVALLGALFFLFVLGLVGLGGQSPQVRSRVPGYVFALSTVGLAAILYFAYASFFVLQAVCLLCVTTYVAVIGLFAVSGSATRDSMGTLAGKAGSDLGALVKGPTGFAAAVAFVVVAGAGILWFPEPSLLAGTGGSGTGASAAGLTPEQTAELERYLEAQPRLPVSVPNATAPVVVLKFNDYQCPACAQTHYAYKEVVERYERESPGVLQYMVMDYPLEGECNTFAQGGTHTGACEAAVAVRLARETGRADAMQEWLYANQPRLSPDTVRQAAREVGGVEDFDARYEAMLERVRADVALGGQLDVRGTPTFFMNGLRLPGLRAEFFDAAIQWELRRVQGAGH